MTQQSEAYVEDYGSDGIDQYDAANEFGDGLDEPVDPELIPDEEAPLEPAPLAPDPLEVREQELKQRETQFQEQQENLQLQGELQGYYNAQLQAHANALQQQGYYEEQVQFLARDAAQKDLEKAAYQVLHKRALEKLVSLETGVPRDQLKDLWDEGSMRQKAEQFKRMGGPESQIVKNLEARVARAEAALRRNGVPPQQYNQPGTGSGSGGDAELIRRYANGQINWSPRVQKALDR